MDKILGRAERIDLPELNLKSLPAKVDTGAYSSSIDCESTELVHNNDKDILVFVPLRAGRTGYAGKPIRTTDFDVTEVINANGTQERFVIYTDMIINGERTRCRFTLTDRSKLRYPVLIGRRFIRESDYLVDVRKGQGLPDDEEDRNL
ncbi:MAG: ATP-dependent zinc protease family protein [Candidatus Saccharimonadales bacterium]